MIRQKPTPATRLPQFLPIWLLPEGPRWRGRSWKELENAEAGR